MRISKFCELISVSSVSPPRVHFVFIVLIELIPRHQIIDYTLDDNVCYVSLQQQTNLEKQLNY